MVFRDPLYGSFLVPEQMIRLLMTPEVRRLTQVRLINTLSPTISALSDVRRFSHTVGVLYLALQNGLRSYSLADQRAFYAAVLMHDVGTPPFGHVLEYHLNERGGWHHEGVARDVLWGLHQPQNTAHQIYAGRTLEFRRILSSENIDLPSVERILKKEHPLSCLLFGSLDFDNIDNVARMASAMGIPVNNSWPVALARLIGTNDEGELLLEKQAARALVDEWATVRRRVYDVLLRDPATVASQAVLWTALGLALDQGLLEVDDWPLTDDELLNRLLKSDATKIAISNVFLGELPQLVVCIQVRLGDNVAWPLSRAATVASIERSLRDEWPRSRVLGFCMFDNRTFGRKLLFVDKTSGERWTSGNDTRSVLLYGFLPIGTPHSRTAVARATRSLLATLPVGDTTSIDTYESEVAGNHEQVAFDFTTT